MGRILLIEDNPENLELMSYLLNTFGHTTAIAQNGADGLRLALEQIPDLVICDIQMPRLNGYEVAREMQRDSRLASIPRIAVTALAMVGDREKILAAGFDSYISKPIEPENFVPFVEKYLPGFRVPPRLHGTPAASLENPQRNHTGPIILVVDDSPANLELARTVLGSAGYQVAVASNGREALELVRENRPALILSDVHMRGGNGFECIQSLRSDPELCAIPVIFITAALYMDEVRGKCLELGAARFLTRPLGLKELLFEVRAVLRETAAEQGVGSSNHAAASKSRMG